MRIDIERGRGVQYPPDVEQKHEPSAEQDRLQPRELEHDDGHTQHGEENEYRICNTSRDDGRERPPESRLVGPLLDDEHVLGAERDDEPECENGAVSECSERHTDS